jgi:hypothetical protein
MKKLVLAAFVTMLFSSAAFAATARQNTGCGLGTILWKNKADGSIVSQSLQATTNGTFGNQTFGITSGTLDCGTPPNVVYNERLKEFVVANMDNLAKDIAQGRGETLEAFAELMGVPAEKRPEFYASLQAGFTRIYTSHEVQMASVMDNISTVSK